MTFSYDPDQTTTRDIVRFRIGDTDSNRELLSNEELNAIIARKAAVLPASVEAVEAILALIARDIDRNAAGVSSSRSQMTTHYEALRGKLVREMMTESEMFVGGLSKSAKAGFEDDSNFVKPSFQIGQFDNPQAGSADGKKDDC